MPSINLVCSASVQCGLVATNKYTYLADIYLQATGEDGLDTSRNSRALVNNNLHL